MLLHFSSLYYLFFVFFLFPSFHFIFFSFLCFSQSFPLALLISPPSSPFAIFSSLSKPPQPLVFPSLPLFHFLGCPILPFLFTPPTLSSRLLAPPLILIYLLLSSPFVSSLILFSSNSSSRLTLPFHSYLLLSPSILFSPIPKHLPPLCCGLNVFISGRRRTPTPTSSLFPPHLP